VTIPFHAVVLPVYLQMLDAVENIIGKAQSFCAEGNATEEEIMQARLAPDMLDFSWQIKQLASHALDGLNGARAGRYAPDASKPPTTLAGLAERVMGTRKAIAALDPAEIDALVGHDVLHVPRKVTFMAEDFVTGFSMPNFYFHVVTAYDILRAKGVKVGKADFLGRLRTQG
jgi:uncharacterized protein